MNMNRSRWERAIDALCGVAFVAFLVPFFVYVAGCYAIHRISLRILVGFKHLRPTSRTPIGGCPSHPHIATGDAIGGH
jgi:hypothetical protein